MTVAAVATGVLAVVVHSPWLALLAAPLALSLLSSAATRRVAFAWRALGHGLEQVNRTLLLGAIFLLVLTPTALVRRLLGRQHPAFGARRSDASTWVVREHRYGPEDLERPW